MNLFRRKKGWYDAEFDIEHVAVFSVERAGDVTVIGYWDKNGEVQDYEVNCHPEKHARFVARFRNKMHSIRTSLPIQF